MPLGRFKQHTNEIKRYSIDYTQWLDAGETVSDVVYTVQNVTVPPLEVLDTVISDDNVQVTFYVSGGVDGESYEVVVKMSTTGGQVKEDELVYIIEAL